MPTVRVRDLECFYADDYFGEPWTSPDVALLQAGYAANSNHFVTWVPHLADRFRVIRRDAVGHGRTSAGGVDRDLSLEALARDVVDFLDVLGLERVHYVGERTGGMTGIVLAALHPERVRTVTIYGCPTLCGQPLQDAMWAKLDPELQSRYTGWCDAIAGMGGAFAWHDHVHWLHRPNDAGHNAWQDAQLRLCDERLLERYATATLDFDVRPYLGRVQTPTLVLAATGSYRTNVSQQCELREGLVNSELDILEGFAGRADDPVAELACRRIRTFIDGHTTDVGSSDNRRAPTS